MLHSCAASPRAALPREEAPNARFSLVALGTAGGLEEGNLTSFLLSVRGDDRWVALDAGTLFTGLRRALARGSLGPSGASEADTVRALRTRVRAVLLSHPHLDHVAGLALVSPEDAPRALYGSAATLDALRDNLFNGVLWANFLDEGREPRLGRYHPVRLAFGAATPVADTPFEVTAYPLAHGGDGGSTAFLLRAGGASALYLGDTGPDAVERSARLGELWTRVAPLVREGSLRVLLLECSFPSERPDARLYSHLTPRWVRAELDALASRVASAEDASALRGLAVVFTHLKPSTEGEDSRPLLARQLGAGYRGARFVLPEAGERLAL